MTTQQEPFDFDWERLGEHLRAKREYLGLSQKFVSDRTGIPRSAVSDIERGERKVDSFELKKLADLYMAPVAYFLDNSDEADAADHAIAALARAMAGLTEKDQADLFQFAEFLRHRNTAVEEKQ
jgi:transcriptional regulator with XRE-family HTH domain